METTKSIIIRTIVALCVGIAMIAIFHYTAKEKYYSTLEEAFRSHSGGERNMGEILFVDKHENNLSVFHVKNGISGTSTFTSHYLKKEKNDKEVYLCVGVETGKMLNNNPESIKDFQTSTALLKSSCEFLHKSLNRTPICGFSFSEEVYDLKIDNQPLDKVIEFQSDNSLMYYWYFSDLKIEDHRNIRVSFE